MTNPATTAPGYQVQDYIDVDQMKRDLSFSGANLSDAMIQQASMFSHYGVLAAQASRQVDVVKLLLETAEAAVYTMLRNKAAVQGEKLTEAQLEKSVSREERVISMKKALNEAKRIEATAKTAVEAFRHKRDMLVQMGLIAREELKGELRISAGADMAAAREQGYKATQDRMRDLAAARARNNEEAA